MAALSLDNEFLQYWSTLTVVQKESLLSVIKSFVESKNESLTNYNEEIDAAVMRVDEGVFYKQDEVRKMLMANSEK